MDQSYFRGSGGTCLRHRSEQHLDVTFVHLINSLFKTMDSPTPEAVFNAYKTLNTDGKFDAFESLPAG